MLSSAVIWGGGSRDEDRGSEAAEKEPPWEAGKLTADDIWGALLAICEGLMELGWVDRAGES